MSDVNPYEGTSKSQTINEIADLPDEAFGDLVESEPAPNEVQEEVEEAPTEEIVEESQDSEEAEPAEESEELEISTVSDVAKALGIPVEELQENLLDNIKVDGEESQVSLKELKAGYQKDADYRRKTAEISEHRNQLEQEYKTRLEKFEQDSIALGQYLNSVEQIIQEDSNSLEMQNLRQTNPAEWTAKQQELGNRLNKIQQLRQQAADQWTHNQTLLQEQADKAFQENYSRESQALQALPGWSLDKMNDLNNYLSDNSFTPEQVNRFATFLIQEGMPYSKLVSMVDKARQFDTKVDSVEVAKKKVKTLPKVQTPTKPTSKLTVKKQRIDKANAKLKKSGKRQDAANAILESGLLDQI